MARLQLRNRRSVTPHGQFETHSWTQTQMHFYCGKSSAVSPSSLAGYMTIYALLLDRASNQDLKSVLTYHHR